jgi:hypothetical protein
MSNLAFTGSIFGDSDSALPLPLSLEDLLDSDSDSESESNNKVKSVPKIKINKKVTIIDNNQVFRTFVATNFIYCTIKSKRQLLKKLALIKFHI